MAFGPNKDKNAASSIMENEMAKDMASEKKASKPAVKGGKPELAVMISEGDQKEDAGEPEETPEEEAKEEAGEVDPDEAPKSKEELLKTVQSMPIKSLDDIRKISAMIADLALN